MIVECERCKSKFNLNPDLVKPTGTIVRCSICKNIFIVHPEKKGPEAETFKEQEKGELNELFDEIGYEEAPKQEQVSKEKEVAEEKLFKDLLGEEKEITEEKGPAEEPTQALKEVSKKEVTAPKRKIFGLEHVVLGLGIVLFIGLGVAIYSVLPGKGNVGKFIGVDISKIFQSKPTKYSPDDPGSKKLYDPGSKKLSLFNVSGKFIKNQKAGTLFVVTGTVRNRYSEARSYILVRANLVDSKGNVLKSETAYAGNIIAESDLEKMSLEEISARMKNMAGYNNSNINIEPNGTREFMVIFNDIPQNVSEFTVQAVESKPAEALKK